MLDVGIYTPIGMKVVTRIEKTSPTPTSKARQTAIMRALTQARGGRTSIRAG